MHKKTVSANSRLLLDATKSGDIEEVIRLIPISNPKYSNSLPFRMAAKHGQFECLKQLLPHSDPQASKSIALRRAAELGRVDMIEFLLPICDPQALGSDALNHTITNGHQEAFDMLLPHSDPTLNNSFTLHLAAVNNRPKMMRSLLGLTDPSKSQAISHAALRGHLECVEILYDHSDLSKENYLVWRWAVRGKQYEILNFLIEKLQEMSSDTHTGVHMALSQAYEDNDEDLVEYLFPYCNRATILTDFYMCGVQQEFVQILETRLSQEQSDLLNAHIGQSHTPRSKKM